MPRGNYLIIWHDRHSDDCFKVVLNATHAEAEAEELKVAQAAGWENETDASKYGYGDYGYGEDYYIDMIELKEEQIVSF